MAHQESMHGDVSLEEAMKKQGARWLLRLLQGPWPEVDSYFFNAIGWTLGEDAYCARILAALRAPKGKTRAAERARAELEDLKTSRRDRRMDQLREVWEAGDFFKKAIAAVTLEMLEETSSGAPAPAKLPALRRVGRLFELDELSLEVLFFFMSMPSSDSWRYFFETDLEAYKAVRHHFLARIFACAKARVRATLAGLYSLGLIADVDSFRLSSRLEQALYAPASSLKAFFCKALKSSRLSLEEFTIPTADIEHVTRLLKSRSSAPLHILLYGEPGSGKTSFVSSLAQSLGMKAWSVTCAEDDSTADRRTALVASVCLARRVPGSIVLVDEAEQILATDEEENREASSKAWLNEFLEQKGTRIIWITNRVSHLDPAVRRRFTYSIHFGELPFSMRFGIWHKMTATLKAAPSEETLRELAGQKLPPSVIEQAVGQARRFARSASGSGAIMKQVTGAYLTLLNNGEGRQEKSGMEYRDAFSLAGISTSLPVERLLGQAVRLSNHLSEETARPGMGAMLFYGPPGTGKTALARYMASSLGKKLICRRAEDLLDKYVGENEKNIAAAFQQAEAEKAILLLDEVDTFLFSRERAVRSWEQSMVNTFLTSLETFRGLCVCTTNFCDGLDAASLRRFSFKVEFAYAGPEQLRALYDAILRPLAAGDPCPALLEKLAAQDRLAPGDFNAVRIQFWLEEPAQVSHEDLIEALCREQRLKAPTAGRRVGFM